jgi:maltooligosyltrehalose synthase
VTHYDPEVAPDPQWWLALDEQERSRLVDAHHRAAGIELPNATLHAAFHVIVENQVAGDLDSVVRAMARLQREGLTRHDALHAIGSVVAELLYELLPSKDGAAANAVPARYDASVEGLTAESWRKRHGS